MDEMSRPAHRVGLITPGCLILLLLASLLVARFSESAVLQQRQLNLLSQQLSADRIARKLLQQAQPMQAWECRISQSSRCHPDDAVMPAGTELRCECTDISEQLWLCVASVDAIAVGGLRVVVQRLLRVEV